MQLKSLRIFCDVVQRRSFSRAADDNGISQSSASQVVHQLEEKLGLLLIDRSKRPFVLTPEGEHFYNGCRQIIKQYEKLKREVYSLHDATSQHLVVASIYSVGLAHMSAFMRNFATSHSDASVRLEYLHPHRVIEVVEQGEVDLGLVSYPEDSRNIVSLPWREEPIVLVCHPDHRLAHNEETSFDELGGESFVAFEPGLRIRAEIDRALLVHKIDVNITLEFDNIETMKRAVEIGEGISLLPEPTVAREISFGSLAKVPLREVNLTRPLGIIHRRDQPPVGLCRQFVNLLQADSHFDQESVAVEEMLVNNHPHQG